MALCSMCPTLSLTSIHAPGHGWQCVCGEINCSHYLACSVCIGNRYEMELKGWISNGHLTALGNMVGRQDPK
jgi:hypothetical protein